MTGERTKGTGREITKSGGLSSDEAFIQLIKNIYERDVEKYNSNIRIKSPFDVTVDDIEEIRKTAVAQISQVDNEKEISFSGVVGFADGRAVKYDSYHRLIEASSNKEIPSRLNLKWSVFEFGKSSLPQAGYINVSFVTERADIKDFHYEFDDKNAYIEISVTGSNDPWTKDTFEEMRSLSTPLLFHPILKNVIRYSRSFFGPPIAAVTIISLILFLIFRESLLSSIKGEPEMAIYEEILKNNDVSIKIDRLAEFLLLKDDWKGVIPIIVIVISFSIGGWLIKKVADIILPQSSIIMGASGRMLSKNRGLLRFIWGAIVVQFIISLVVSVLLAVYFG